jgi:Rrf2 family protein
MSTSTRFAVATHVLTALAHHEGPISSETLAQSVGTSAVVIRQLLQRLQAAELVHSKLGKGGGALLSRPAHALTLLEVFDAVEKPNLFNHHACDGHCHINQHILKVLQPITDRAEAALRGELAQVTLQDVHDQVFAT